MKTLYSALIRTAIIATGVASGILIAKAINSKTSESDDSKE